MRLISGRPNAAELETPSSDDLMRAVADMDGDLASELVLFENEDKHLIIGGGPDKYCCLGTVGGERRVLLSRPRRPDDRDIEICVGQPDLFPEAEVLTQELALRSAEHFRRDGSLDPALLWDEEL
jgi:hypothetical protein